MANPTRYADPSDPPFLIIHGDADPVVPIQQSEMLKAELERAGIEVTLRRIPSGNHGRSPAIGREEVFREIVEFLDWSLDVTR
jgi:dipeptidyl aminopeptidase/acylaminoacyl peptidase